MENKIDTTSLLNKYLGSLKEEHREAELKVLLESLLKDEDEIFSAKKENVIAYMKDKLTMSELQMSKVKLSPKLAFKDVLENKKEVDMIKKAFSKWDTKGHLDSVEGDVKWEKSGMLDDLDDYHKKMVIELFNRTASEHKQYFFRNERMEHYLFPCIRRIYSKLFLENNNPHILLDDIDVKYIMTEIDRLYPCILLLEQTLSKIDVEAELTEMFCTNYTKIIEPKKYKDYLKLREESKDEFGDKLCYCGHTSKCSCADPGVSEFNSGIKTGSIKIQDPSDKWNIKNCLSAFEFNKENSHMIFADDFKKMIQDKHEEFSDVRIKEMYPEECEKYDMIVHIGVWHSYNSEPKSGDAIDGRVISEVSNDGVAYFINFVK